MPDDFQIVAKNANAPFTLKLHRGDGMTLLAMNWKAAEPPRDFVGFAIEYKEPGGDRFWGIKNRINFPNPDGSVNKERTSSRISPIQKFRWVHFPVNAEMLNVAFTRGFVSSQAFLDRYVTDTDGMDTLIPDEADEGLQFVPTHAKAEEALSWMRAQRFPAVDESDLVPMLAT